MSFDQSPTIVPFDLHTAYAAARDLHKQTEAILLLAGVPHRRAVADAIQRVEKLEGSIRLSASVVGNHATEIASARMTTEPVRDAGLTATSYHALTVARARRVVAVIADTLEIGSLTPFPVDRLRDDWQTVALALEDLPEASGAIVSGIYLEMLRAVERRCERLDGGASERSNPALATDAAPDHPPLSADERDEAVAEYLARHPRAQIKEVAAAIGASTGAVSKSATWRAEMERRKANRLSRTPLIRQLKNDGEASILADNRQPEDSIVEDDPDAAAWQRLIDAATPDERAKLHKASLARRADLIAALREQDFDAADDHISRRS